MMSDMFYMSLTSSRDLECMEMLLRTGTLGPWPATEVLCDYDNSRYDPRSLRDLRAAVRHSFSASWEPPKQDHAYLSWARSSADPSRGFIKAYTSRIKPSVLVARGLLGELPFEYGIGRGLSSEWGFAGSRIDYSGPNFGEGHYNLGWMCAFKGAGHDELVSRRWLEHGPWRLIRGQNDLSIVQFHDLRADDETALEQAMPGHDRMCVPPENGFIWPQFSWDRLIDPETRALKGLYDESAQTVMQVVAGRKVELWEMLEAAAIKSRQPLAMPVRQVAYVFIDELNARAHLHELWLRGLEVRTFIRGRENRIDEDYQPPPPKTPDWVKRVQDREGE